MQGELSLEAIAEISIALAGFSGLVAMVRSGPVHDWHPRVRAAFWISLNWSIAAVVLCLVPSLFDPMGSLSWPLLNGIASLVLVIGLAMMIRIHFRLNREGSPTQNPLHWLVNISVIMMGAAGTLSGFLGIGGDVGLEWYRVGVISCLMAAFPGFLASFRVRSSTAADETGRSYGNRIAA